MTKEKEVVDTIATEVPMEDTGKQQENRLNEIVIGIPVNTAMMRVSVLTVNEDGQAEEKTGEFNFEQLLQSRAKYLQLTNGIKPESEGTNAESGTGGSDGRSAKSTEEERATTKE